VRASEQYLVLEFGFNLSEGCGGVGTRGNGVPHLFFSTTPLIIAFTQLSATVFRYSTSAAAANGEQTIITD